MSDDSLLLLAVADVIIDGRRFEGVGVEPTVAAPFPIVYASRRDPQLGMAVTILAGSLDRVIAVFVGQWAGVLTRKVVASWFVLVRQDDESSLARPHPALEL